MQIQNAEHRKTELSLRIVLTWYCRLSLQGGFELQLPKKMSGVLHCN
jgi:hypothetical protein